MIGVIGVRVSGFDKVTGWYADCAIKSNRNVCPSLHTPKTQPVRSRRQQADGARGGDSVSSCWCPKARARGDSCYSAVIYGRESAPDRHRQPRTNLDNTKRTCGCNRKGYTRECLPQSKCNRASHRATGQRQCRARDSLCSYGSVISGLGSGLSGGLGAIGYCDTIRKLNDAWLQSGGDFCGEGRGCNNLVRVCACHDFRGGGKLNAAKLCGCCRGEGNQTSDNVDAVANDNAADLRRGGRVERQVDYGPTTAARETGASGDAADSACSGGCSIEGAVGGNSQVRTDLDASESCICCRHQVDGAGCGDYPAGKTSSYSYGGNSASCSR